MMDAARRRLLRVAPALLLASLLASLVAPARADAQASGATMRVLRVGTKQAPPFSMRGESGTWRGLSVELWRDVAADLELEFEWVEYGEDELEELLAAVAAGELDVAAAAVTLTAEREQRLDFTHAYFDSGLGIAIPARAGAGHWLDLLAGFFGAAFWRALAALAAVLLIAAAAVWVFERRRNPDQFGGTALQGLGSAFWWSAVTMTTVGYGDKAPRSAGGRAVALVWMFASVIVISSFTAAIASSITVGRLRSDVRGPEDLPRLRVATVAGSTSEAALEGRTGSLALFSNVGEAAAAVVAGRADALVYDAPLIRWRALTDLRGRLDVLAVTFQPQRYAFALPSGSPLREALNRALLVRLRDPSWHEVVARYLGQ